MILEKIKPFYAVPPVFSGGLTGLVLAFAFGHMGDRAMPAAWPGWPAVLAAVAAGCAAAFAAWYYISLLMAKAEGGESSVVLEKNSLIFLSAFLYILLLPVYVKFYPKLAVFDLKVVGWLYLPWGKFTHVNFAGYLPFMAAGAVTALQAFLLMAGFVKRGYITAGSKDDKKNETQIFAAFLIFYVAVTSFITFAYPPTGDEPHYLTIAKSMISDRDVDLKNDYVTQKSYRKFYPVDIDWKSIHNTPGKDGKGLYSLHSPGMPLVIAPFYAAGGRFGVQLLYNALTALLCALIYRMLRVNFIGKNLSFLAAALAGMTVPLSVNSSLVLTEVPAAVIIAWCTAALRDLKPGRQTLLFFAGISFLPFLHSKLALFSVMLFIAYYVMINSGKKFSVKHELLNLLPACAAAGAGLWYYYAVYGKFAPLALTSIYVSDSFSFIFSAGHSLRAAAGMLFDRDFGMLPYNLLTLLSIWGLFLALKKKDPEPVKPFILTLPYIAIFLFWSDWGGSMTPARQMIPALPATVLLAAYFCKETGFERTDTAKAFAWYSAAVSCALMAMPVFRYTSGKEKLYALLKAKAGAIMWILPSFNDIITSAQITVTALWIGAIVVLYLRFSRYKT